MKKITNRLKPDKNRISPLEEIRDPFHPVFCFRYLHRDYHLDKCTDDEKKQLMEQIVNISTMTWDQLQRTPKKGIGSEKINLDAIKARIPVSFDRDVPHLLAFRFDGKKPFVGYRDRFIFHVFFIDRDFTLYNHE